MALRRSSLRQRGLLSEINVVPYIDVMLVLVVILMVAAPFVNPSLVNLPSVSHASRSPQKVVEVIVYHDAKVSLRINKKLIRTDMNNLVKAVQKAQNQDANVPVVIAADKHVRYENVVEVMKRLQRAEIKRVGLALKIEK